MKYIKYKKFLPEKFIEENNNKINNSNNRAVGLLIILNCIMLPLNISKLKNKDYSYETQENHVAYENYGEIEEIKMWLDLTNMDIIKMSVDNDEGEVYISNRKNAYQFEDKGFDIREIKKADDNIVIKLNRR